MRVIPRMMLLLAVALALTACGKDDAPATTAGDAAAPAAEEKEDGGLFDFIGEDTPAEPAMPELGAFKLESVTLGTALDGDNLVREPKTTFSPKDAIHAAVLSSGPHPGLTLVAHWTAADGTVVAHSEQPVVATGPTVTTFTLRNGEPWPAGMYQLAVQVEGKTLQSRAFEVVDPEALR